MVGDGPLLGLFGVIAKKVLVIPLLTPSILIENAEAVLLSLSWKRVVCALNPGLLVSFMLLPKQTNKFL